MFVRIRYSHALRFVPSGYWWNDGEGLREGLLDEVLRVGGLRVSAARPRRAGRGRAGRRARTARTAGHPTRSGAGRLPIPAEGSGKAEDPAVRGMSGIASSTGPPVGCVAVENNPRGVDIPRAAATRGCPHASRGALKAPPDSDPCVGDRSGAAVHEAQRGGAGGPDHQPQGIVEADLAAGRHRERVVGPGDRHDPRGDGLLGQPRRSRRAPPSGRGCPGRRWSGSRAPRPPARAAVSAGPQSRWCAVRGTGEGQQQQRGRMHVGDGAAGHPSTGAAPADHEPPDPDPAGAQVRQDRGPRAVERRGEPIRRPSTCQGCSTSTTSTPSPGRPAAMACRSGE